MNDSEYIVIGEILKPRGLQGELKVYPLTKNIRRYDLINKVFIDSVEYAIENVRYQSGKFVLLKLKGIDSIDMAEKFRKKEICIHQKDALEKEEDEFFYFELEGLKVYTDKGGYLGVIDEILDMPAHPVYVVKDENGNETLLPAAGDTVKEIDIERGIMTVELLEKFN
jgi:16S rRNA processing protein RimM